MADKTFTNLVNMSFDNFTSTLSHMIKDNGDKKFIDMIINEIDLDVLNNCDFYKLLYIVGCIEYLCHINDLPAPESIYKYRGMKMPQLVFSSGVETFCKIVGDESYKSKKLATAIPEFLAHNLVVNDVRDAY